MQEVLHDKNPLRIGRKGAVLPAASGGDEIGRRKKSGSRHQNAVDHVHYAV